MADSLCASNNEMDDVHRWLSPEILRDRCLALVEDLAARLASVLVGSAAERTQHRHAFHVPPPAEECPFINNAGKMLDLMPIALPEFTPAMRPPPPPAKQLSGAVATC
ncbi:hypothetical protein E2562_004071 [Oryza meyeriana var. granulata]|uniref:Uncharacterized protein n=1 Tax=Oryza meyeriana var. granulata TaxID=110450 RepID=A0A6G1BJI3_9ORYZ|nr:hypothetical protein E2562_004071 [Oryza meyeriana var. granulata]